MPLKTLLRSLLIVFILIVSSFHSSKGQAPVITSISAYSAEVNGSIVITGQNFSTTLSHNRVFFGTVEGIVQSASATQLQVLVPAGISCDFVSVNVNGLICFSFKPFSTRFLGSGAIDQASFKVPEELLQSDNSYLTQMLADIDGDGKLDIIQWREGRPGFLLSRNTSDFSTGTLSFADPILIASGIYPYDLQVADLDRDGKPEIIMLQNSRSNPGNFITILKNISIEGDLSSSSFSQEVNIPAIADPLGVRIADFDLDGKPDIFVRAFTPTVALYKNITSLGVVDNSSLSSAIEFSIPAWASNVLIGDLTSDGKPEIVLDIVTYPSIKPIFLKNNCSSGAPFTTDSFSFVVPAGIVPEFIRSLLDINGDNKLDVLSFSTFYANVGTENNLAFATPSIFLPKASGVSTIWNDFDGDGLLDAIHSGSDLEPLASRAVNGNVALLSPVDLKFELKPFGMSSGDLNGDGKPDLIFRANVSGQSRLFVAVNKSKPLPDPTITSITPSSVIPGSIVRITGENFGEAFINNIVTLNGNRLDVIAGTSTSLDVVVRHPVSAGFLTVRANDVKSVTSTQLLTIAAGPIVHGIEPKVAPVNTPVVITGENFSSNANENIVLFGTVRAQVTEANASRLVVNVPAGASYGPVSVMVGGYTGKSTDPFTLSYPQGKPLDKHTFLQFAMPATPANFPVEALKVADFDGDGKTDIVVVNKNSIIVYHNTSSGGSLSSSSFSVGFSLPLPTTDLGHVEVGDLDGDGKPDLVLLDNYYSLKIYRNTSGPGSISFESSFSTPGILSGVIKQFALEDVDNDGKLDLVHNIFIYDFQNYSATYDVWILRNVGQPGILSSSSFEPRQLLLPLNTYFGSFAFSDINKDHLPDLIGIQGMGYIGGYPIAFFENTSTPGNPVIGSEAQTWTNSATTNIVTGDLNDDGIIDIVGTDLNKVTLYSSVTPITTISTTGFNTSTISRAATRLSLADLSGDGKAEIICGGNSVALLDNSTTGLLSANSFSKATVLPNRQVAVCATDLDGDGLTDLVGLGEDGIVVSHNINEPLPALYGFTPAIATEGIKVKITGKNFSPVPSANSVKVNGSSATVIASSDTTVLIEIPASATSGKISVEVNGNIATSLTSILILKPQTLAFDSIPPQQYGVDYFVNLPPLVTSAGLPVQYSFSNNSVAYQWYDQIRLKNAGTVTITATQAGNAEYYPLEIKRTLVVKKGISEIFFAEDSLDRGVFVDAKPFYVHASALDYSDAYYTYLPITISSSDTNIAALTDSLVTVKSPGSTFLTFSHPGSQNYEPYSVTRELIVKARSQTIKFDPVFVSCTTARVFDLTASASSGLTVTITSSNPDVASVNGKTITLKSSGITELVATQGGNKYYPAATSVSHPLQIDLKSQTITFEAIPDKHIHSSDFPLVVSSSSGLPVKVISTAPDIASVVGNVVSIHGMGEAELVATQEGSGCFLPAEPVSRKLTINLITNLEEAVQHEIGLFPNPANGPVTITLGASSNTPINLRVLNNRGETMLQNQQFNGLECSVDVTFLPAGLYLIELTFKAGVVYKKIIKR